MLQQIDLQLSLTPTTRLTLRHHVDETASARLEPLGPNSLEGLKEPQLSHSVAGGYIHERSQAHRFY